MAETPASRVAVAYILHDDAWYLADSIASFRKAGPVFAFISRTPCHDAPGDWEHAAEVAREAGAEVVLGEWRSEPEVLRPLGQVAESGLADRVYVQWDAYWKSREYVIRPREQFTPSIGTNPSSVRLTTPAPLAISPGNA